MGAVLLMSTAPILVRVSEEPYARSAFLRCLFTLPAFALVLAVRRRGGHRPRLSARGVATGLLLGGCMVSFHAGVDGLGAGTATVVGNLHIVMVPLVARLFLGQNLQVAYWVGVGLICAGVVSLTNGIASPVPGGPGVVGGVACALASSAFMSAFLLTTSTTDERKDLGSALVSTASVMAGATLLTGLWAGFAGVLGPGTTASANLWLLLLALGPQVGGFALLAMSTSRLPAVVTSATMLLVPVLSLAWSRLLLAEQLTPHQLAGAATVIIGIACAQASTMRQRP